MVVRWTARRHEARDIRGSHPEGAFGELYGRVDSSSATYRLSHGAQVDPLPPRLVTLKGPPYIANCFDADSPDERHFVPLRTTTLIRVPGDVGFSSIAMFKPQKTG